MPILTNNSISKRLDQPGARQTGAQEIYSISTTPGSPQSYLYRAILAVVAWAFPSVNLNTTGQGVANQITNRVESDVSGFLYWFDFVRYCDYFDNSRCNVGRQGYGFSTGLGYTILAYILGAAFFAALLQMPFIGPVASLGLSIVIPVLAFLVGPGLFLSLAYYASPSCAAFFPAPIIPDCIANDLYVNMRNLYAPCISFDKIGLPGLTDTECPPDFSRCVFLSNFSEYYNASSSDNCTTLTVFAGPNERVFVDCSAGPYYFTDGFRNAFYLIAKDSPGFYNWLETTTFAPIRQFMNIAFVKQMSTFDLSASDGQFTDTWSSCNKISSLNWSSIFITSGNQAI